VWGDAGQGGEPLRIVLAEFGKPGEDDRPEHQGNQLIAGGVVQIKHRPIVSNRPLSYASGAIQKTHTPKSEQAHSEHVFDDAHVCG